MSVLETERLTLRRVEEGDAAFLVELMNEPGWLRFIGDRGVRTVEDARAYMERAIHAQHERHGISLLAVVPREAGVPVGLCGLVRRDALPGPDLGFAFLERWSGRGFAREAAAAVLRHAREELGLARVLAVTSPDNERSLRLLASLGFRRVGETRLAPDAPPTLLLSSDGPSE